MEIRCITPFWTGHFTNSCSETLSSFLDCGTSYLYIVAYWWVQNFSFNLEEWKQEILMTISLWTGLRCWKCYSVTSGNVGGQPPSVKDILCNLRHQYATPFSTFHIILKCEKKDITKKKCVRVNFPEALAAILHLLFLNKSITYPTPHRIAKELLLYFQKRADTKWRSPPKMQWFFVYSTLFPEPPIRTSS